MPPIKFLSKRKTQFKSGPKPQDHVNVLFVLSIYVMSMGEHSGS